VAVIALLLLSLLNTVPNNGMAVSPHNLRHHHGAKTGQAIGEPEPKNQKATPKN
jgi:hypothetical protein